MFYQLQLFCARHLRLGKFGLLPATLLIFTICGSPLISMGQTATATLSGTVVDENGAFISGANVAVINLNTRLKREAVTNDEGVFTIPLLPPSVYQVRVEHSGFAPIEFPSIVLNIGDRKALQIKLRAGDVSANVVVDSNSEPIRTDAAVATVVDRQFAANIPLNGRSFQSLIALTPGVVFPTVKNSSVAGGQFSVNGQRTNANYFSVDGVSSNYGIDTSTGSYIGQSGSGSQPGLTALGGTNSLVSIDALQEFKIDTSSYAPEFGRTPGGQISLLTRSGTNDFNGTLFEYLRNDVLDANDWFANRSGLARAKERQNDFGGILGGPIIKNRTFFFFSYEGLRLRQPTTSISKVPTIQARQVVSDAVKPFINALPIPNLPAVSANFAQFAASYSNPASINASSVRIDHSLNRKMILFGTYKHSPSETHSRTGALNQITSVVLQNDAVTLGATLLASPSATNDLRLNWSRARADTFNSIDSFGGAVVPEESLLFASPSRIFGSTQSAKNHQLGWAFFGGGISTLDFVGAGDNNIQRQMNLVDTLSWVKGNHQLKVGIDYRRISPILDRAGGNGTTLIFRINPLSTLFQVTLNVETPDEKRVLFQNFSAFAQDAWKVNQRLMLTYGLRWELNPPPHSTNGHPPAVLANSGGTLPSTLAPPGTPLYKTRYTNLAPRFGISYQVSRTPGRETVLRGGAGVFYDLGTGILAGEFSRNFPYNTNAFYRNNASFPLDPAQTPLPIVGTGTPGSLNLAIPNLRTPYTMQWNAALEQSLGRDQTLTISYVGAAGRQLLREANQNLQIAGFPTSTLVLLANNDSRSDYRALQVQFQRRLAKGIQGLLSYTFGRSSDISSDDAAIADAGSQFLNLQNEYGPSDFDVRHSLNAALTLDLPSAARSRVIKSLTEGWGLDALWRFRTALPTNVFAAVDFDGALNFARPNVIPGVPQILFGSQYPGGQALNPTAFEVPPSNTQGNFPRNSLRFFRASQLDLALRRQFPITERVKLQFRFEFFNVLNYPNFTDPSVVLFGGETEPVESTQMLSRGLGGLNPLYQIGGPRSGQASLKIIF